MNKKTLVGLIITFLALLGSLFVLINAGVIKLPEKKDNTPAEEVVVVEPDENEKKKEEYRKLYDENKAINEDYVGEIIFDSGLINVSFVQAFRQIGLLFGLLEGVFILKERCTAPKVVGLALVLVGLVISVL